MPDPNYRAALALLRTVSKSGESRAMVSVLVRTGVSRHYPFLVRKLVED